MNKHLTDIILVIDRSGSMVSCKNDAEGGVNTFIQEQKSAPGEAFLTLVQFDTEYDFVHTGAKINEVTKYTLIPRGGTALYDAVGRAINETGKRLSEIPLDDRPGLVVFAIVTDGEENSSKEFTGDQVREMIEKQSNDYSWQFTYLGANQDAFKAASAMSIPTSGTLSYAADSSSAAYASLSANMTRMRTCSLVGQAVQNSYTQAEQAESMGKSPAAVSLGQQGGLVGGPARASSLTPQQLSDSASKASKMRWEKHKKKV